MGQKWSRVKTIMESLAGLLRVMREVLLPEVALSIISILGIWEIVRYVLANV